MTVHRQDTAPADSLAGHRLPDGGPAAATTSRSPDSRTRRPERPCHAAPSITSRTPRVPTLVFPTSAQAAPARRPDDREPDPRRTTPPAGPPSSGLATGSTPVGLYRELIRLHKEDGLDFSRVVTFNLDEYFPMPPDDPHSYHRWMHETFFNHVNIQPREHPHPRRHLAAGGRRGLLRRYEQMIRRAGGIDLQILGIGRTGHIGFNEPGSTRHSRTRLVTLDPVTRRDAASGFFGEENVPHQALTMGVGTILEARKVVIWPSASTRRRSSRRPSRSDVDRRRHRQLPAAAPRRHVPPRRGGRRRADRRRAGPWVVGPVRLDAGADPPGGHLAEPEGRQGPAEALRRRLPRARAVRTAPRARPGRAGWAGASSTS